MSRRASAYTQADVTKAIKAAQKAGAPFVEIAVNGGKIVIHTQASPAKPIDEEKVVVF